MRVDIVCLYVRRLRQVVGVILLLLLAVAPAMACMLSGSAMSEQERACCRMMHNDCGHMQMSAGHDCCEKVPASSELQARPCDARSIHAVVFLAVYVATWELPGLRQGTEDVRRPDASPPPESPPASISILRV